MKIDNTEAMTGVQVAEFFGVTRQAVTKWAQSGCPRRRDGKYSLQEVVDWQIQKLRAELEAMADKKGDDPESQRYRAIKADLAQIELDRRRGKLLDAGEVQAGRVARIREVKRRLMGVPKSLAHRLAAMTDRHEIEDAITAKIREACNAFARE